MDSEEIQKQVTDWYSANWVFAANEATYPKHPDYVDCKLLNIPNMITDKYVLNLGCCYPADEIQFSKTAKTWYAIDISKELIKRCKEIVNRPNVVFSVGDMASLSFQDEFFDTVLDFSSGDHLTEEKYKTTLKEVYRVLKPLGCFIVTYANLASFKQKDHFGDFGYFRATSEQDMVTWVTEAGLQVVRTENNGDRIGLVAVK